MFFFFEKRFNSSFKSISEENKRVMTLFFRDLIAKNEFGYVLLGDKPVAIGSYFLTEPLCNLFFFHKHYSFNPQFAWDIFEKSREKFNSKRFILFNEPLRNLIKDGNIVSSICTFVIINKQCFLKTVAENLDLFQEVLGPEITPEVLLAKVAQKKQSLFEAVGCDQGLYGILLGYGRANALAFKRYHDLGKSVHPHFFGASQLFSLKRIKPSKEFHSLEEEYAYLEDELTTVNLQTPLSPICFPAFRALKTDEEGRNLQKKYGLAHRHLLDIYSKPEFLQIVFSYLFD